MKIMRKLLAGVLTTTTLFASFGVNAEPNEARYKQLRAICWKKIQMKSM